VSVAIGGIMAPHLSEARQYALIAIDLSAEESGGARRSSEAPRGGGGMESNNRVVRIRTSGGRFAELVMTVGVLSACSGTSAPAPSPAALPTPSPAASTAPAASATASIAPSPAASPSAAIATVSPIPGAPDSKVVVQLVAAKTSWRPNTLKAPAAKAWHVRIDDQDSLLHHNFTVASGKTFEERIFQVPNFVKGTYTFDIPALPAGEYLFICTIHPDAMTGTLTLE